jgi:hypothetical protein
MEASLNSHSLVFAVMISRSDRRGNRVGARAGNLG